MLDMKATATKRCALVALAAVVAALFGGAASAGGGSTCSFSGSVVRVELLADGSSGILERNAAGVILYRPEGSTPEPCGSPIPATVVTTDRIKVVDVSDGGGTVIVLDVSQGHFSDGTNEIPINIDLGAGSLDAFGVIGGADPDNWTFGANQRGLTKGNLQSNNFAEIKFRSQPDFGFGSTGEGNDRACSLGSEARDIPRRSLIGWVWVGGAGADKLCGGTSSDRLVGKIGEDNMRGGGGGDVLKGGGDADSLKGGASGDLLKGNDGPDDLKGGPGFDRCSGGAGADQEARCER